jgi:adenosylcobyric acid synthase
MAAIMIQGTSSDAGKSLVTAGLCRAFTNRGLKVRPFKPQNMSNNAAVTPSGGEIGRAQALQARACRSEPNVDMNPILLKPQTDVGSQLIVRGKVQRNITAREYYTLKDELLPVAIESFEHLKSDCDLVVAEGAGSPAEVNLRHADIANMGFAVPTETPVVLVGDIERGGVIASVLGTWHLLENTERALLTGYIVNKFRGDPSLFDDGLTRITQDTGLRSFGVLPWFEGARKLPAEDALALGRYGGGHTGQTKIIVPVFSRIANFDDLDPLAAEPDIELVMIRPGDPLPGDADLVLLTGSKSTRGDLALLHENGWDIDIKAHVRRGNLVLGLCAGYQMLGQKVDDPDGIESAAGSTAGLGLLDVVSRLEGDKTLKTASGTDVRTGLPVSGYEMHIGKTTGPGTHFPMLRIEGRDEGAVSGDGLIAGCYLHGLFANDDFRHRFLTQLKPRPESGIRYEQQIEDTLNALAIHCEAHLDLDGIAVAAGVF